MMWCGGLSNALPELVKDGGTGGVFELRTVPNDEPGMSPVEIWCNEAQERYVLAVKPEDVDKPKPFVSVKDAHLRLLVKRRKTNHSSH